MSAAHTDRLAVRWTIGNLRPRGFELLRLSIACAYKVFGPRARYVVCVNSLSLDEAQNRTGAVPEAIQWRRVTKNDVPTVLRSHSDGDLIEGMGWKLVPLRTYPDRYELALDNDCILWDLPAAMRQWLEMEHGYLFAEDVERSMGSFHSIIPPGAFNAGIRGLPPGEDLSEPLEEAMKDASRSVGSEVRLVSEIEEQGLQAAAMTRRNPLLLVKTSEVSICSPFWPRSPELGSCGAHFVGMNAPHIDWNYYDRPADEWLAEHWHRHRPSLYERAGLEMPEHARTDH